MSGQQTSHQIYQELMIVNYCLVLIKIKHFFLDFELFPWTFQQNIDIVFANEHRVLLKNTFALNLLFRPVTQFSGVWGGGAGFSLNILTTKSRYRWDGDDLKGPLV